MTVQRILDNVLDATLLGYTKLGPAVRGRAWREGSALDATGRRIVITGATSGLGRAATSSLVGRGADVVAVGRNDEKLRRLATEVEAGPGTLATERADLSLMADTRALAERLLLDGRPIHVLVNNAGAMFAEREVTTEGIERTLATNVLSHYLLTELLLPRLVESAPSRVINVSSGGMYSQRIQPSDLEFERGEWSRFAAYARTKRAQVILTQLWAEQLEDSGVVVHAMHPGWSDTPGVADSLPTFRKVLRPVLRNAEEGADTVVWLAIADEPSRTSGLFWHDRRPRPFHRTKRTQETPEDRELLVTELRRLSGLDDR